MIDFQIMEKYFAEGCSSIAELFVSQTLYNEIIEHQEEYFKEENSFVYNNQIEGLSLHNYSTRVFLLFIRHIESNPIVKNALNELYNGINMIAEIDYATVIKIMLLSISETTFFMKFNIPSGIVELPVILDLDYNVIMTELMTAIEQYEE